MRAAIAGLIAAVVFWVGFAMGQKAGEARANGVCKIICEERK
jgi:hypothetical protein